MTLDHTRVPGGAIMVLGIASARGDRRGLGDELRCAIN